MLSYDCKTLKVLDGWKYINPQLKEPFAAK